VAILATILSLFKGIQMLTYRDTKKSFHANVQTKQPCQCHKKIKSTQDRNLIFISDALICENQQLSQEEFDKAAHYAMLEMLSIDPNYYHQIITPNELI
jgi:hypothetical protein